MRADALLLSVCPTTGFGEALLLFDGPAINKTKTIEKTWRELTINALKTILFI